MSETMTITLPDDVASSVRARVGQGGYASADEAIADAIRDWVEVPDTGPGINELCAMVRSGDESGPSIPAEQVYAKLQTIIDGYRGEQ